MKNKQVINYSDESPSKELDVHSLVEVIMEYFNDESQYDSDYLDLRINLLRDHFGIPKSDEFPSVIDELLGGLMQFVSIVILPLDGAIEVPNGLIFEATDQVNSNNAENIKLIHELIFKIRSEYVKYLVLGSVLPTLQQKTLKLSQLISEGLPESAPDIDFYSY